MVSSSVWIRCPISCGDGQCSDCDGRRTEEGMRPCSIDLRLSREPLSERRGGRWSCRNAADGASRSLQSVRSKGHPRSGDPAAAPLHIKRVLEAVPEAGEPRSIAGDRKSTRLNSSHQIISYAV